MKMPIFFKTNDLVKSVALFYISANLFNVRLKGRQKDSHIHFCIQPVVISPVM